MSAVVDYTQFEGKTYNKLTVLKYEGKISGNKGGIARARFLVSCVCGNQKVVDAFNVLKGHSKSCGCSWKTCLNPRSKQETGQAAITGHMRNYLCRAEKRSLEWMLTRDEFVSLCSRNCHYCGIEAVPRNVTHNRPQNGTVKLNGLDRVDPNKGYTHDNVVACCKSCNFAKNAMSVSVFREWVTRVATHLNSAHW